ncbi:MAG: hypothetical protein A4E58_00233 [Syntrophorhabdus sp. PtaB.Bin006]|nr:MAG: hypothetical protein A4E58_00233 [Syntrophorhabdus sp. PtaB.Bin006]
MPTIRINDFVALPFDGCTPRGTVEFHQGFKADGQQRVRVTLDALEKGLRTTTRSAPLIEPSHGKFPLYNTIKISHAQVD